MFEGEAGQFMANARALKRVILIVMSCAGHNDFHDSFADLGARRCHGEDSAPPLLSLPQQLTLP